MPFYDYVCTQCGKRTEVMHGINAEGPKVCEVCGGSLRKAMSTPAIVFRGSGWAKKERSSAARSASAKKDGEPSSTSDAGKDGSSGKDGSGAKDGSGGQGRFVRQGRFGGQGRVDRKALIRGRRIRTEQGRSRAEFHRLELVAVLRNVAWIHRCELASHPPGRHAPASALRSSLTHQPGALAAVLPASLDRARPTDRSAASARRTQA